MTSQLTIVAAIISFSVSIFLGKVLIPKLHKLKFGQTILDIGPSWHKKKQGTPTMGGIMFIAGITAAVVVCGAVLFIVQPEQFLESDRIKLFAGMVMALAFGFVGFVDDYVSIVKKQNIGLKAKQKLVMQFLIAIAFLATIYISGDHSTALSLPGLFSFDLGPFFYYPVMTLFIVWFVNAVNITDGVDGLAGSVTFVAALGYLAVSTLLSVWSAQLMSVSLAAGCIGFLFWNFHPAKIFMGDTGSMFLGGMVVAIAFALKQPLILIFMGIIYICEAGSVVLQVISFKTTGKRIFKMSPIHHHFEMSGWKENKIVLVFSLIAFLFSAAAVLLMRSFL